MKQPGLTKTYLGTLLKHRLRQVDTAVQANTGRVLNLNTGNMLKHISIEPLVNTEAVSKHKRTSGKHRDCVKT